MIRRTFLLVLAVLLGSVEAKAQPQVRVLVLENRPAADITIKGEYRILALPSLDLVKKGSSLPKESFSAAASGIKIGEQTFPVRGVRVVPANDRDLFLNKTRLRGVVDLKADAKTGTLSAVNTLDVEGYLYGVLHNEVAHWWPMQALKAQAIAARTYALYQTSVSRTQPFDLKSSTASQVYGGATVERFRAKRAVDMTRGQVLTYRGKIFPAYFHATCAGMTAGASELWNIHLKPLDGGVVCDYCKISPHYYWHAKVPLAEIEAVMNRNGRPLGRILKIAPVSQTPSGRVGSVRITGTAGDAVMAAKDFRVWIGGDRMRSTFFSVDVRNDQAQFHGEGWGHGVGLCQWGALGQSLLGRDHETILKFYYPGSDITDFK